MWTVFGGGRIAIAAEEKHQTGHSERSSGAEGDVGVHAKSCAR